MTKKSTKTKSLELTVFQVEACLNICRKIPKNTPITDFAIISKAIKSFSSILPKKIPPIKLDKPAEEMTNDEKLAYREKLLVVKDLILERGLVQLECKLTTSEFMYTKQQLKNYDSWTISTDEDVDTVAGLAEKFGLTDD